jgi:uncharacterized protein (DUF983 family)
MKETMKEIVVAIITIIILALMLLIAVKCVAMAIIWALKPWF